MRLLRDPVSGLSHAFGLCIGAVACTWLLVHARHGSMFAVLAVYAACLVVLYAASSLYHLVSLGDRVTRALRLFDHAAIFLFVAGTATPVLFRVLDGGARVAMLSFLWGLAAAGIAAKFLWRSAPRALYTALYVGMGWSVLFAGRALTRTLSPACLACVVAGGLVYTLGAVVYATRWPDPKPPHFGFHEIWHLFVLAGSALHLAAIAQLA